ncbi:hypothetical protein HCN44_007840 [Aphidius gifuensis]|uniref:DNA polymerase epsilon catalytic subunit n=1 Tax=Aphidius gifuensis TaxID=684658 RepID=A0A834XMT6_APHGI|nr:DNA polymerase epsilon catalytic subunit A [Aphidius gifuensis]KAF7989243.1 hypothetical protein HCN44_007840 [Aphidius gifuensis]
MFPLRNSGKLVKQPEAKRNNYKNVSRENTAEMRLEQAKDNIRVDSLYGFERLTDVRERVGYLINMHASEIAEEDKRIISGIDYYFLEEDCTRFKVTMPYYPYFYIKCTQNCEAEVSTYLSKKYTSTLVKVECVKKEDLDLPNHLIGLQQKYLKLSFANQADMQKVRMDIKRAVKLNQERAKSRTHYSELLTSTFQTNKEEASMKTNVDHMENIIDIREFDVQHHVRASIDLNIFVGTWYSVKYRGTEPPSIVRREDLIEPVEPIVLAYDIETTKLPLKFPDANSDQIMMISYMIDGQGFLITNREIISQDIESFEYTPKPEMEGLFTVFNEADEKATIRKFFDHILDVRPHIFVTYNGDFFDWPFVETRAAIHGMNMKELIGWSKSREDVYVSRPAIHMDALSWVRRDSYLPVGSQGLKAVTKAKLRYNPVEVEPEEMCRLAAEDPVTLANYSVSDAVATYYLYQKYVHPFIFALCTIIPMEPDEVLRKGSGTLCETLLMVEAFRANIIFPNKQEAELNKLTSDGHLLDAETYVGGHVEALESGVFRADIPYRFKLDTTALDELIESVPKTLRHTIQEEEKLDLNLVTNFDEIVDAIKQKLGELKAEPLRLEQPRIYHLDVGAMYPNIILTNRLQPSAMVDETVCAACDFNTSNAKCKRTMSWQWRGDYLSASLGEYQRVQQQLETEKFPPQFPGGPRRAFHTLSKQEQADFQKKRLTDYCKKAYKKTKVQRIEERQQTICQKENSFYVDTVRAFRDRRYEYKGLTKVAKQQVAAATAKNDASEIKSAKNREVLYDSLQLAHKCILNSFYGYVMRRGSRWFSMEMGGIVCLTGAHIIMKAREIVEKIGRPLELDTDGIWCILPASFPDNYVITTNHKKKTKVTISYPNAVLNFMVKDQFTNSQYHELVDPIEGTYEIRQENSIFFEVDGPYLGMVLPSSKEEGKRLKKRYAVFNFDGTLAELKGFEVKRRGELQLIKIFQSSVFDSFLKGKTLEECYQSVAKVADYWLDVLYSKGTDIPDAELFELISENKSMSKKLEDYGSQKSTSISTAKRLAEFLGGQMLKDAGLACKFIISKKPYGAPVAERAIPLAIFQSDNNVKGHYLRKWLKEPGLENFDIREVLDWNYYIERLSSTIQKIITIPAAMQGVANPVPRVKHPDWLHKRLLEKNNTNKQRKITDLFSFEPRQVEETNENDQHQDIQDIEDSAGGSSTVNRPIPVVTKRKRVSQEEDSDLSKSWKEVLGSPPSQGSTRAEQTAWLEFHKKKWAFQAQQRSQRLRKRAKMVQNDMEIPRGLIRHSEPSTITGFFRRNQRKLLESPWQIIQISETSEPGMFRLWVLIDNELNQIRLIVPRIFYLNTKKERDAPKANELWSKCSKILPRSRTVYHLYQYTVPEELYLKHSENLMEDVTNPENEGIYETQMPLMFRAILNLGCVCTVDPRTAKTMADGSDTFHLHQLVIKETNSIYLRDRNSFKYIYLYHHWSANKQRSMFGLFLGPSKRAHIYVVDSVRTNQMPNMSTLYNTEKSLIRNENPDIDIIDELHFEVRVETSQQSVNKHLQTALKSYKNEMKGATFVLLQSSMEMTNLLTEIPGLADYPVINTNIQEPDKLFSTLEWQKTGAKSMIKHFLKINDILNLKIEQSKFFSSPIGNIPADSTLFSADLFYARNLQSHNFVTWCSQTERPDLGGSEDDDNRLLTEFEEASGCVTNKSGAYSNVCIELEIESLAITALLQSQKVNNIDGTSNFVAYHNQPQASLQDIATGEGNIALPSYDETALCSKAFGVLKQTVSQWLQAVVKYKNVFADEQLIHFYRWLRSPNSLLYDPALRRTLHSYMKKLFVQLIAEFKRLGSIIVFSDFNRILICTKKRKINEALEYTKFVLKTICDKELLHGIGISLLKSWEFLLWLDQSNFAGVIGQVEQMSQETSDQDQDEDDEVPVTMNWNLAEILSKNPSCYNHFEKVIGGYIEAIKEVMNDIDPVFGTPKPKRRRQSFLSQKIGSQNGLGSLENTAEYVKNLISGELTLKLLKIVERIHKKNPETLLTIEECPNLNFSGADSMKIVPALEFIKSICKVFSLDKEVENEVYELKKNLLRIINIGCFSSTCEWKDPCISFIIPEVICKACNHTRDVDLCKDINQTIIGGIHIWFCPGCETSYDNNEIEMLLIDMLNRKSMAYLLQDLRCKKCGEVKRENIMSNCTCAGEFKLTMSKDDMLKTIKILRAISKKCQMNRLADLIKCTML